MVKSKKKSRGFLDDMEERHQQAAAFQAMLDSSNSLERLSAMIVNGLVNPMATDVSAFKIESAKDIQKLLLDVVSKEVEKVKG